MITSNTSHYFTPQKPLGEYGETRTFSWNEREFAFVSGSGVFAKTGLDAGSRLLLQTALPHLATLPPGAVISDLGCGWGAVGCVLGAALPEHRILMSDVNPRAVALARHNADLNHVSHTHAWCGDGLAAIPPATFDAILCNPPIRAGNEVMGKLFDDSLHRLKKGGALYLVIRTAQGAKSWQRRLKVLFGNCEMLSIKSGYRILLCTR